MTSADADRRAIAERLLESVRLQHRAGHHFRRRGEHETLCGRDAFTIFPVHPTDRYCNACMAAAQELVSDEANRQMHAALGLVPDAPHAKPDEVDKRRRWMRRRKS